MGNERSQYEGMHHVVGYISLTISLLTLGFTWLENNREEAAFELVRAGAQREQQRFDREQKAFDREQKAFEREQLAFDREKQRFEREQREYELEQRYAFMITNESREEFRRPLSRCNQVKLVIKNNSKRMSPINVELKATNLCLHQSEDRPDMKAEDVVSTLNLPAYSLAVDQTCDWQFRIHCVTGEPKEAWVQVWINGLYDSLFTYKFDTATKQYVIAQPGTPVSYR